MSRSIPESDEYAVLDEMCQHIPDQFFNHDHRDMRTRSTVAVLDFVYALERGSPPTPEISLYPSRSAALKDLKHIVPDEYFIINGVHRGKRGIDYDKGRKLVLAAARRGTRHELVKYVQRDLMGTNDIALDRSIATISKELSNMEAISAKQTATMVTLQKKMSEYETAQAEMEQALKAGIKENEILRAMMEAAGVSKEVVDVALRQVLGGQRIEDVVASILKRL